MAGRSNSIAQFADHAGILAGRDNTITSTTYRPSQYALIFGGNQSKIKRSSKNSGIFNGYKNYIGNNDDIYFNTTKYNNITTGKLNRININFVPTPQDNINIDYNLISNGIGNKIYATAHTQRNFIVNGYQNFLGSAKASFIDNGAYNKIELNIRGYKNNSDYFNVYNSVYSKYHFINNGYSNLISDYLRIYKVDTNQKFEIKGRSNSILNGTDNEIYGGLSFITDENATTTSSQSYFNTVENGKQNKIVASGKTNYNFIQNGLQNTVNNTTNSGILNGYKNRIIQIINADIDGRAANNLLNKYNSIGNGNSNLISGQNKANSDYTSKYNTVANGRLNKIEATSYRGYSANTEYNFIANGRGNEIYAAKFSGILGGSGHTIRFNHSVILGGTNLTSTRDEEARVKNLTITNQVLGGDRFLTIDSATGYVYYTGTTGGGSGSGTSGSSGSSGINGSSGSSGSSGASGSSGSSGSAGESGSSGSSGSTGASGSSGSSGSTGASGSSGSSGSSGANGSSGSSGASFQQMLIITSLGV